METTLLEKLGIQKKLDKIINPLIDEIESALLNGTHDGIWHNDKYTIEVCVGGNRFSFWNANEPECTKFYDMSPLEYIPEGRRAQLRELLRDAITAVRLNMDAKTYRERKSEESIQSEAKRQEQIEHAKRVLREANVKDF